MKKSYIVKNVMKAVHRYLTYGWEIDHLKGVSCESQEERGLKSLAGDIYYFRFFECKGLYPDFIIRFGSRINGEEVNDIDFFRVERNSEGKVSHYKYMFCTPVKGLCLAEIVADTIQSINFMMK